MGLACVGLLAAGGCSDGREQPAAETTGAAQTQPAAAPRQPAGEVVLYTSADEPFARQIIKLFEEQTNIRVQPLFDTEADKTTGLVRRIRAEARAGRPRADVFWSSEPFHTIKLADEDLLASYLPDSAKEIPVAYRDAKDRWIGIALRARVLCYNPEMIEQANLPQTWADLAEPAYADKVLIANPLFGTTRGHVAAMLDLWGEQKFTQWAQRLAEAGLPARLAAGNAQLARDVAAGRFPQGATDTDDVYVLQASDQPIRMTYPDMGGGGTLLLPNTVAILKNGPHPEQARALANFLVSATVEEALAKSDSRNIPVRPALRDRLGIELPPTTPVDYVKVAEAMPRAIEILQETWK